MADPVVFETKDSGAETRDKLNDLAARAQTAIDTADSVVQQVADDAAAAAQAREDAVAAKGAAENAAQSASEDRQAAEQAKEDAQIAADVATQALADIEALATLDRIRRLENARMVDQYGDGPYPVLEEIFIGPNP